MNRRDFLKTVAATAILHSLPLDAAPVAGLTLTFDTSGAATIDIPHGRGGDIYYIDLSEWDAVVMPPRKHIVCRVTGLNDHD